MKKIELWPAIVAVAVSLPFDADARGRAHSSPAHESSGAHAHAGDSRTGENHVGNAVGNALARHRSEGSHSGKEDADLRRIRQERETVHAKADAENIAARNARMASDDEKRHQLREQAAIRAAEEQKRKEAEATLKNREIAMLERRQHQAAWEARCQIKPVMSDEEIATCKEVWSTSAR